MHIEMDITGSKLSYLTGDHVAIFPINNSQLVDRIGELLQTDLDTVISLTNVDGEWGMGGRGGGGGFSAATDRPRHCHHSD